MTRRLVLALLASLVLVTPALAQPEAPHPAVDRHGLKGEPIPLSEPGAFLDEVRQRVKSKWGYPRVMNKATRECDYHSAELTIDFGISTSGRLLFVEVVRPANFRSTTSTRSWR